jgi:Contractile injection system tube protein
MELEKATLQAIYKKNNKEEPGPVIPVQFNPTTLRLAITNTTSGASSAGHQDAQYTGQGSATLTVDLVFDTADEGTTAQPRSVREKTRFVEELVYPQVQGNDKQAPPRVKFHWGDLIIEGIVDSVTLDFDHFSSKGIPLRAKVGCSIKQQDAKYAFLASGPGANKSSKPPLAGGLSASAGLSLGVTGSVGVEFEAQASLAIGGESAADFAARVGLDAEAWRGLSLGGGNPLSLEAGAEIGFSANISATTGLGFQAGANVGADLSLEGAFGLKAESGVQTSPVAGGNSSVQQLFTVAAAGGVSAAIESVKTVKTANAEAQTRKAFSAPAGAALPLARPALPDQPRSPLRLGAVSISDPAPAPPPPKADPRAASFGFSVPLRRMAGQAAEERAGALAGSPRANSVPQKGAATWPVTSDPTTPGWIALPMTPVPASAGVKSKSRTCSCGCSGRVHPQ